MLLFKNFIPIGFLNNFAFVYFFSTARNHNMFCVLNNWGEHYVWVMDRSIKKTLALSFRGHLESPLLSPLAAAQFLNHNESLNSAGKRAIIQNTTYLSILPVRETEKYSFPFQFQ